MSELLVQRISMDSRQVKPGDLFMAIQGLMVDGRDFIDEAIKKGAVAVLKETLPSQATLENLSSIQKNIPIIPVPNLRELIGPIASRFYAEPSKQIPVIGVTGTNGKTSTVHFLAEILNYCAMPCGILGTLGTGFIGKLDELHCTTPDAISVQEALGKLRDQTGKAVAMEVTSHALEQSRVSGVVFHTAIFTNLTRDHLDYHLDLDSYAKSKQKLFLNCNPANSVINLDDPCGVQLINEILNRPGLHQKVIGYTLSDHCQFAGMLDSVITTKKLLLSDQGIKAKIETPWGNGEVNCSLLGKFNYSNLLAAIGAACLQGIPLAQVLSVMPKIHTVNGRMMRFGGEKGQPLVVVDYAHTPDALTKVLTALRFHTQAKLWCVFGCGGDRDKGKRPMMAAIAEQFSDSLCLTQDNPRTEEPSKIIDDMVAGLKNPKAVDIELNRKEAILKTIKAAAPEDCVLIAGKGHENYQILGTAKVPFSDATEVEEALNKRSL